MDLLDPKYLAKKRRFIRTWRKHQHPEYGYDNRYIGQEFDRLMQGIRDHRVGDMALSIWMLLGYDI